ncbi:MAG: glucosamine-6-phosphate deaminase [Planctomycetales bacterium]|nr:glucosamine-6-phosphate deaminase [Planctomycetales bacterium]
MEIVIAPNRVALGQFVGQVAGEIIREAIQTNGCCRLVVATGSSQFEVLDQLVQQPGIDWGKVEGYHLDEYIGLDASHPASFVGYLKQRFVDRVPLKSFFFLNGKTPPNELLEQANSQLAGRPINLMLCGIGENGHLAFNDPPANFDASEPYLIVDLDEACRKQQVGEGWFDSLDQVPTRAISMSIRQILGAQRILCSVPDRRKAEAVCNTLEQPVSPLVPASALRNHAATTLILDAASASLLSTEALTKARHIPDTAN